MTRIVHELERVAARTSERRERHVDVVRAVAIVIVVVGHWLAVAVTEANGDIDGANALGEIGWAHPLTWVFQVMPLFFFIGGYANAASLAANRDAGGDALGWVASRFQRILVPAAILVAVLAAAVVVARAAGGGHDTAATAAWLATLPVWFLAAYLGVLLLAPLTEAAHRRYGFGLVAAMVAVVAVADAARLGPGWGTVGEVNYLVVWVLFHQVGYAWRDGRLPARPGVGVPLAVVGYGTALALTTFGPYPASMVGVPGDELQNTAPPTVALLALGCGQIGVALAVRDRVDAWARRRRPWMAVVTVNAVVLTLFLWHMAAAIVAAVALYASGVMPVTPIGSGEWLALRLVWLPACAVVLAVLLVVFGGIELGMPGARRGATVGPRWAQAAGWGGALFALGGMLGIALSGDGVHGPFGLPTAALASLGAGVGLVGAAARASRRPKAPARS